MAALDQEFDGKQDDIFPNVPSLEELLAGITESNFHENIETGIPVGNESW
jgi:hypothetical protein